MPRDVLALRAPAKINLYLRITGRRPDGYHTLDTLMQKVDLQDEVVLRATSGGVSLHCPGADLPEDGGNLVFRAAELFLATFGSRCDRPSPGVAITLTKNIPVAAGLGGGSSDAAATLAGLDALFACHCTTAELAELGLRLGADVPFFLFGRNAFVEGIGEVLQPTPSLSGQDVLLVNPGFPVSTRWAYQTFALTKKEEESNLARFKKGSEGAGGLWPDLPRGLHNDLEAVTLGRYPEIGQLKHELLARGATAALMSGSGPTVFGLFADRRVAERCLADLRARFAHCWLVAPLGGA
jgi:4-diphosphocytidyl-2-C-methyl-D-erythritol kinase